MPHGPAQKERTQAELERVLTRGEFFVAYLTTFPESLSINHGVLVYGRGKFSGGGRRPQKRRYGFLDPNIQVGPGFLDGRKGGSCFCNRRAGVSGGERVLFGR